MKKINQLNEYLKKLELQKSQINTLEEISLFQFIKYKIISSKERKIKTKIQDMNSIATKINLTYNATLKNWIENPKINCIKYDKLRKKAEYRKNVKLYKLGYLEKKPISPLIQKIISYFPKINFEEIKFFPSKNKNLKSISKISKQKIDNLAVNVAKISIKSYRKFNSNYKFIRNHIVSTNSIRYIKRIIQEARRQIDYSETHIPIYSIRTTPKSVQFRESLKFSISSNVQIPNEQNYSKKKITYPSTRKKIITNNHAEYTL